MMRELVFCDCAVADAVDVEQPDFEHDSEQLGFVVAAVASAAPLDALVAASECDAAAAVVPPLQQ